MAIRNVLFSFMMLMLAVVGASVGSRQVRGASAPSQASVMTATGTGTTTFLTSAGGFLNLTAVAEEATLRAGKPRLTFPHGFFSFKITDLASGGTTTITITLPSSVPSDVQYWRYGKTPENQIDHWYQMPITNVSGDRISMTVKDGGLGDEVLIPDGQITGQGGPGEVPSPAPSPRPPPISMNESEIRTVYATLGGLIAVLSTTVVVRKRRVG
jgi:hypothetical protein